MTSDLSNQKLVLALSVTGCVTVLALLLVAVINMPALRPGGAVGQSIAILGSGLLCMSAIVALLKRLGRASKRGFSAHVWLACTGVVMVGAHTGGNLAEFPALLLLTLAALMALGVWARTTGAQHMASTFGSKSAALSGYSPELRQHLATVIERKRTLLKRLDPSATEATFSVTPVHWLRTPLGAWRYQRLVREEKALIGTDQSVVPAQAYWRRIHQLLALGFVLGLLVHVVLVTFFAGYVAEGRDIYWWHLAAWNF
jgi:hypothetical protein